MKLSRIVEELERQGIEPTYVNIAIYAVFVSEERLVEQIELNQDKSPAYDVQHLEWIKTLFL